VLVDGIDVREIPLRKLREGIGFVSQEAMIFSDTVRNNVIFGRRGISEARLEAALRIAHFYEEALALENGLDTLLGEKGITLSGGQRQRLTIARALLSEPPVLILDDALSMVDTRTEEGILTRIFGSRQGKTNIIVSNRPSAISRADVIVVLERGELAEVGDHATLLEHNGTYAHLYERQLLAGELEAI
jgi:ATP-binding cassette subfamily B protein